MCPCISLWKLNVIPAPGWRSPRMGKISCYIIGSINAPINQSITSWAIKVHIYTVVLTVRPSSTSRKLHWLDDEEGRVTRVSWRPFEGWEAFQRSESNLGDKSKVKTECRYAWRWCVNAFQSPEKYGSWHYIYIGSRAIRHFVHWILVFIDFLFYFIDLSCYNLYFICYISHCFCCYSYLLFQSTILNYQVWLLVTIAIFNYYCSYYHDS